MLIEMGRHLGASLERVEYLTQLQAQADQMTRAAQVRHAVTEIIPKILQSQSLEVTFQVANQMIRRMLKCDRVAIHRFNPDWSCTLVAESAARGVDFLSGNDLEVVWPQIDLQETQGGPYRNHETLIVNNIHTVGYSSYEIEALEDLELKAFVVVPIFKRQQLWGVLGAYQTTAHRSWTEAEISALNQIAIQISVAMQQLDYLEQLQQQSEQLAEAAEREKLAKEKLQQEVMHLLLAVRPALDGDLTVRVPVTENEVGTIADVYNNTLGSLRQIVSQMLAASNQVTQTSQASEAAIAKLTLRAQEQCETLNEALEQVQIVRFSARTVESNAAQVNAAVQQAKETVTAGDTTINRTVDEMENIQETVVEASERLQRLSESFQKISRVVNLISNFTTQTQLLALNASIEATRAGEYGRGFAVVANEVRSLARQSADAAIEIDQLVQEIQGGLTEVSTAMQTGMQHVVAGTTVVMDARQNLNAIVDTTTQISQLIAGISQATHDQSQQCQSLTETMTEAAFLTDQTAEESKAVSTSFKDLLTMAEDLQAKSQRFKVH
jgi:methyl-accepting chemotaxis protein PixJ